MARVHLVLSTPTIIGGTRREVGLKLASVDLAGSMTAGELKGLVAQGLVAVDDGAAPAAPVAEDDE